MTNRWAAAYLKIRPRHSSKWWAPRENNGMPAFPAGQAQGLAFPASLTFDGTIVSHASALQRRDPMQRKYYQHGAVVLRSTNENLVLQVIAWRAVQKVCTLGKLATKKSSVARLPSQYAHINSNARKENLFVGICGRCTSQEKMPRKHPTRLAYSSWMPESTSAALGPDAVQTPACEPWSCG